MQSFTVVLLYPEYVDTGDGDRHIVELVTAQHATQAVAKARNKALEDNPGEVDEGDEFTVAAVVPGVPDNTWQ